MNKDIVETTNEFDSGFEEIVATGPGRNCFNRSGCNRLFAIILAVVVTKVPVVVTINEFVKLVSDLERASRLTGSESTGSGLTGSGLTGSKEFR